MKREPLNLMLIAGFLTGLAIDAATELSGLAWRTGLRFYHACFQAFRDYMESPIGTAWWNSDPMEASS